MPQMITQPVEYSGRNDVDFEPYTDGNSWLFVRGSDYSVKSNTFVTAARRFAKDRGLIADAKRFVDEDRESVALRFRPQPAAPGEQAA